MVHEHVISHVVGSLYDFSETAKREVVGSFMENSSSGTSCHFNDCNLFIIHASLDDEKSLAHIVNYFRSFISAERDQQPDVFEDKKVTRISGTHPSLALVALIDSRIHAIMSDGEIRLIEHENIIRKWSPNIESGESVSKFSSQLLGRIGGLCGCRIEYTNHSAELLLKADREQDIEKGISKLERLNKMMVDEISFPQIHSFYILEGEMSINLQLVAFKELDDKRPVTTLLRKDSLVSSLRDLCVLVLVKGSNILQVNSKAAASTQESRLWNDHVYNCNQNQALTAAETPKKPETLIDKWVSEVTDTNVQGDAFSPELTMEVHQPAAAQHPVGVGKEHKGPMSPVKKPVTKRARTARTNHDGFSKSRTDSQHGNDGKEAMTQEIVARHSSHQTTEAISAAKESESFRQPPSIEPPYMPPRAIPSHSLSRTPLRMSQQLMPSSATWKCVVRGSKSGSLVDLSVPNEGCAKDETITVPANLQDATNTTARDLKYTMNQKKGGAQPSVREDTAITTSFEENVAHLLVLALPRIGRVQLAVDIGRLLINQQCSSSEFRHRSFKTNEFSSVLPKGRTTGFETIFTNMLTVRSSEAETIVNLLLSRGRRLFQQQPISRKVTYVIICKTKERDQIIVEYKEDGDFNIQGSEILMGTLDWHFPKRAWDARLRLTSEKMLAMDYQRQVKGIVDNMEIGVSGNGQSLELRTKTIDDNLSIESITLQRETLHPVTVYPDLILHVTEYQDLKVHSDSERIYIGSVKASNVMTNANRLWWGAKISSVNASAILEENVALELGERATWDPSSIINGGVVKDLFAAAKEVVTQIDHIGFFNRGEGSSNWKGTEKRSEITQDISTRLKSVDPGYW